MTAPDAKALIRTFKSARLFEATGRCCSSDQGVMCDGDGDYVIALVKPDGELAISTMCIRHRDKFVELARVSGVEIQPEWKPW